MRDRSAPLTAADVADLAWNKMDGLLPAVVQEQSSGRVLMLGYMNREALDASIRTGLATFFSRSRNRLWQKGETSGNHLHIQSVFADCDDDALLVVAVPEGPTCHTGNRSCFGDSRDGPGWLADLSAIVHERSKGGEPGSYTCRLLAEGVGRVAQKVGEEGVEVALAAVSRPVEDCAEELADLFYHVAVLMESLGISWSDVISILKSRHESARRVTA